MKPVHAGLAAAALGLAIAVAAGCTGGADKEVSATRINVNFRTPINETSGTDFCEGAQSLVLALDSAGGQSGSWDRVFVLGVADESLYGCGRDVDGQLERCASSEIRTKINSPGRVLAEWLDVPPQSYEVVRGNVVCRGMYVEGLMGTRDTVDEDGIRTLTLNILLLRVGDTNYLHDLVPGATSPRGKWMAASPLVHPSDLTAVFGQRRDPAGGHIVVAGGQLVSGQVSAEIHVFHPSDIAFLRDGDLPAPAAGLTATSISSSATASYVLFAGGWGVAGTAQNIATAYDYAPGASMITSFPLERHRAHHSAIRLEEMSNPPRKAIGLYGGCDANYGLPIGSGVATAAGGEVFYLGPPLPSASCLARGPGYLCVEPQQAGADLIPRCFMAAGPLRSLDPTDPLNPLRGWFAGGFEGSSAVAAGPERYEVQNSGTFTRPSSGTAPFLARAGAASVPYFADLLAVVGGATDLATVGTSMYFIQGINPGVPFEVPGGGLQDERVFLTATRLADRSLLVTGGHRQDGTSPAVVEIGRTTAVLPVPIVEFSYPAKIGGTACTTGAEAGCVVLKEPRYGHTATRINGTRTWLNGAVVIAGGSGDTVPEIYVPAYTCSTSNGLTPVAIIAGAEDALEMQVDYCDRGRAALGAVTNPNKP